VIPWRFVARLALLYVAVTVLMVLAISPYFSVGWDPQIFAGVGRSVIDNADVFDLYQATRQAWGDWGFPYPPLYPHLLAPFVAVSALAPALPDWLMVRALPVLCDVALAVLLYLLIWRKSNDEKLARLGAALWLFNPLTLYQTAIQAHQESSWLVCVLAAYALLERRRSEPAHGSTMAGWLAQNLALPSLLMACAVTLKQSAILFYIPYGVFMLLDGRHRVGRLATAAALFALVFGGLSLPYYLHSPDFFYLVYVDVSNMPVQTQSAVVWLLALKGFLTEQTRSTFFLLKHQTIITMALAAVVSFVTLRRRRDLAWVGLLMALLFFLTSKKVMGYHYVLLAPFLLLYALPRRRFDIIALAIVAASWIIVSPYYAPWARAEHLPLYATIGTPNTLLWLFLLVHIWRGDESIQLGALNLTERLRDGAGALVALAIITVGMVLSSVAQWPCAEQPAWRQMAALVLIVAVSLTGALRLVQDHWRPGARLTIGHAALAVLLIPVYFAAFALTQESTQIIETLLGGPGA